MMQPAPEDIEKMKDMVEKFRYFLQKYEGFGVVISSCHFWKDNEIRTESRIEFTKMGEAPKVQTIQKVFS